MLETNRLYLKLISKEDREFLFKHLSDRVVTQFMYDEEAFSDIKEADKLIESYSRNNQTGLYRWVLCLKETGEKIGTCGFHNWNSTDNSIETGYDLSPFYWGKGLMKEAMVAVLGFIAKNIPVERVDAIIYHDNKSSVLLAESLGFVLNGEDFYEEFRGVKYLHRRYSLI